MSSIPASIPESGAPSQAQAGNACAHPSDLQTTLFPARDYITGDQFRVLRCRECGLTRTDPAPSPDIIERYYPAGYYGERERYPRRLERLLERIYERRVRRFIRATHKTHGRALDIGCGRGSLLRLLADKGWSAVGTELSEPAAHYPRDVLGLDVRIGDVLDLNLPAESFDLVILWHVLEHVTHPARVLSEVSRLLRPNGVLIVAVPNFGSPEARIGKAGWFHLDVPRHLNHFDVPALRSMLREVGLAAEHETYGALEYDTFSAIQTTLNVLGIRLNLLYNMIRSRGAKMVPRGNHAPVRRDVVATVLLAPVVGILAAAWAQLASFLRLGATVTVTARKRN